MRNGKKVFLNKKQLVHGAEFFASESNRQAFPAVVIFPQCPQDDWWARMDFSEDDEGERIFTFHSKGEPKPAMRLVLALLDEMLNEAFIDKDRVYASGLSMGGMGTFDLLSLRPKTFAAAFPVCGGQYENGKEIRQEYGMLDLSWGQGRGHASRIFRSHGSRFEEA